MDLRSAWICVLACAALVAGYACAQVPYGGRPKPADGSAYSVPVGPYPVRVEKARMITMRDGVRLAVDIYFPVGVSTPAAVVYTAAPYGKRLWQTEGQMYASHGFIFVVQDERGTFESEGQLEVEHHMGIDGYDTIEWISRQPWSNGKVGHIGCSSSAESGMYELKFRPPALKAMIIGGSGSLGGPVRPDGNVGGRFGGVQGLADGFRWFRESMRKIRPVPSAPLEGDALDRFSGSLNNLETRPPEIDYPTLLRTLPVSTMMDRSGVSDTDWIQYRGRSLTDSYWQTFNLIGEADHSFVPTIHMSSWNDYPTLTGQIYYWDLFKRNADSAAVAAQQYLFLWAGGHCDWDENPGDAHQHMADMPIGDQRFDVNQMYLDWFDHWLRDGNDESIAKMAKVQYYTTGANRWNSSATWPPSGMKRVAFYLAAVGPANSRFGGGLLQADPARNGRGTDSYVYDPMTPVPTGGNATPAGGWGGAPTSVDQSERDSRNDVLIFQTPALESDIEATGPMSLVLNISTDVPDTDIMAWLSDVDSDGTPYPIQEGELRLRYREGYEKEVLMHPGKIYEATISVRDTSHVFMAGHRIRLSIASSNFPRYVRNLNIAGDSFTSTQWKVARITIHHDVKYRSRLILPIVGTEHTSKNGT